MGLNFYPIDVAIPALIYILFGSFAVFFTIIAHYAKQKLYIGEAILATAFGIIIGPHGAGMLDPQKWGNGSTTNVTHITLEVMRITLAIGLFAIGVDLPKRYLAAHWKSLAIVVIPTMAFGWLASAGFMYWLFPGLTYISALCISACLTPTDPVLSVAITTGAFAVQYVPENIRNLIAAESAANDGLAYPFLSISVYLSIEASKGLAIGEAFLLGWLYQVVCGTVLGAVLGYCFSYLLKFANRREFINRETYIAQYIAMSFLTIGIANVVGMDDLLAAFAAGSAISWDGEFKIEAGDGTFATVIDSLLNIAAFIYIGAWLPFQSYNTPELSIEPWRLVVLFLLIALFRRLPFLLMVYKWVPDIKNWKEAAFAGHFGPMGVSAIFISTLALTRLSEPHIPPRNQEERLAASLYPLVSFVVLGSIITHGFSIPCYKLGQKVVSLSSVCLKPAKEKYDWESNLSGRGSASGSEKPKDEIVIMEGGMIVPSKSHSKSVEEVTSTMVYPVDSRSGSSQSGTGTPSSTFQHGSSRL